MDILKRLKLLAFSILLVPTMAWAAIIGDPNGNPPDNADEVAKLIERVQQIVLGAAGAIAVLMIIWGGITLATSGGNEERTAKGKKILTYSIGGLIFVVMAQFLIVAFVKMLGGGVS